MTINKIGPMDNVQKPPKSGHVTPKKSYRKSDSVNLSPEAKRLAEIAKYREIVNGVSDVRMDKVEEARRKLEGNAYLNEMVAERIAEKIMESFGL